MTARGSTQMVIGGHRVDAATAAWRTVGLFGFLYAASFVDRMILAVLTQPIKADIGLSDTEFGIVFGTGFAIFYVCAGLPLAQLADRGNRRLVLLGGVLLWSLSTFVAAFSQGYGMLLATRAGVAIGEAVLMPVAVSIIADLFRPEQRALPTSVFSMIGAVMGAGSLVIGGAALLLATQLAETNDIAPWRLTLVLVALPGLVGAALVAWLVPEPARGPQDEVPASSGATARHVLDHGRLYFGFFLGVATMLITATGLVAWGPTVLVRDFGFAPAAAAATFGGVAALGATLGCLSVPLLLRWLRSIQPERAIVRAALVYAAVTGPVVAAGVTSGALPLVLVAIAVGMAGLAGCAVLPPLLAQAVTPARMRARVVALYLLINSLLSLGLGPPAVAMLAARHGGGLAGALGVMAWASAAVALAFYIVAHPSPFRTMKDSVA